MAAYSSEGQSDSPGVKPSTEDNGLLARISFPLDAISYIVAFFLIDTLTFGPPPVVVQSPSAGSSNSPRSETAPSPIGSPGLQHAHLRRVASEGDHAVYSEEKKSKSSIRRSMAGSESSAYQKLWHNPEKSSPTRREYFEDRSLHHHQKKLFERQMAKTLLLQPFIKWLIIAIISTLLFVLYAEVFGLPTVLATFLNKVQASLSSVSLFSWTWLVQKGGKFPTPRTRQTGLQKFVKYWHKLWARILAICTSASRHG